ncbi:MAG: hypothetical protein FWB99_05185 [Treponema sp.]|nr:hypothetical protein [Treponema sp.]
MKCYKIFCAALFIAVWAAGVLPAQSTFKGMSLNGATGLYSIPTARIGWERSSFAEFGLNFGYHTIISEGRANHLPKFSASLFNMMEVHAAFDIQPDPRANDFIAGMKFQLPVTMTAVAIGGNFQVINMGESSRTNAGQIYIAVTYFGQMFNTLAETTVVLGRSFIEGDLNSNIDFGVGLDLLLLPRLFDNMVHWITDFAIFSYSVDAFGTDAWHRGVLNTGLRINLASVVPALSFFRFAADVLLTDAFDENRGFAVGLTFGVPLM